MKRLRRTKLGIVFAILLVSIASLAGAIDFVSVELGIISNIYAIQYPCPLNARTAKWAVNDSDTLIVVQQRDVREGDQATIEITVPNGRTYRDTFRWYANSSRACTWFDVPVLGTDAETWLGTWRASILMNNRKAAEVSWEVVAARDGALEGHKAYLRANPGSPRAHFRVGAAAALAGQDALAEAELKEAIRLDVAQSPSFDERSCCRPDADQYLALGRLYQRQGNKDLAREWFLKLKALLLGRKAEQSWTALIQEMLDDHLKALE